MPNRLNEKFKELQKDKKKAFIAYITAGFPSLSMTEKLVVELEKAGADIIELGIPFSDPLADGPTIQSSSQWALKRNVDIKKTLACVRKIRKKSDVPIALMTYFNPVLHYKVERFIADSKKCGVDAVIIPDLPPEESKELVRISGKTGIATVFFVSPTTKENRLNTIIKSTSGFIYYVSLAGVTGARNKLPASIKNNVLKIKKMTKKPVCVGFGISSPAQVKEIAKVADGVIVGSAIINQINQNIKNRKMVNKVSGFVRKLRGPIK